MTSVTKVVSKKFNNNRKKQLTTLEKAILETFDLASRMFALGPNAKKEIDYQMDKLAELEAEYTQLTGRPLLYR